VGKEESPLSVKPTNGLLQLIEAVLDGHRFWIGVLEIATIDERLLRDFPDYRCHVKLQDGRQATAAIVGALKHGDYVAVKVTGITKL
jgi:hypothetical protein